MISPSDKFANDLLDKLRDARSINELKAVIDDHEKHLAKLKTVNNIRFLHIINYVSLRRSEGKSPQKQTPKAQQEEMFF